MSQYIPGDDVKVLDTSNGKVLKGTVRRNMGGGKVQVWMHEWKRYFVFMANNRTKLGRFVLTANWRDER